MHTGTAIPGRVRRDREGEVIYKIISLPNRYRIMRGIPKNHYIVVKWKNKSKIQFFFIRKIFHAGIRETDVAGKGNRREWKKISLRSLGSGRARGHGLTTRKDIRRLGESVPRYFSGRQKRVMVVFFDLPHSGGPPLPGRIFSR